MNCHNENKDNNQKNEHKHSGHHHGLMMILCMLPLIVIMGYYMIGGNTNTDEFGSSWLYLIILLCPLSHIFMMRGMHNHKDNDDNLVNKKED